MAAEVRATDIFAENRSAAQRPWAVARWGRWAAAAARAALGPSRKEAPKVATVK